jgi:cell division protein FtsI/penicillin-binding protein 2
VPADGSKAAFFVIDPSTGSMLAMLSVWALAAPLKK